MEHKDKNSGACSNVPVIFFIMKCGIAYFADEKLSLICTGSKLIDGNAEHEIGSEANGYNWVYNYKKDIQWFRRYIKLLENNGKTVRFIGLTEEEFFGAEDIEVVDDDISGEYFGK